MSGIIRPAAPIWTVSPAIRLDRENPYLLLQQVTVYVRDQDRSLPFFVDNLGFGIALDFRSPDGERWVIVAPPDGTARLALSVPPPDSEDYLLIGKGRHAVFLTEDIEVPRMERAGRQLSSSSAGGSWK